MVKSRAEYMKNYRKKKREEKLKTGKVEPKKIAKTSTERTREFRARAANLILSQTPTARLKAAKSSAERGREYRARKALLRKQSKQQESDAIPSHLRILQKRMKSAEATRRWREKKRGISGSSKKPAKTAAERMREYRQRKKRKVTEAKKYESPSTSRADDEKEYEIEINQEVHEDPLDFEKVEVKIEPTDDGNDERIQERSILKVTKAKKYESPSTSKADDENELKVEIEIKQETNEDPFEFEKVDVKVEPTDDVYEDSIQEKLEFDVPIKNEYDESLVVEEHSVSTFTDEESSQHLN